MIEQVVKRNGVTVRFQKNKLVSSLKKAFSHSGLNPHRHAVVILDITKKIRQTGPTTAPVIQIRSLVASELKKHALAKVIEHYELVFLHLPETKLKNVLKRNGSTENFDPKKLFKSLRKAFSQTGLHDEKLCEKITRETAQRLENRFGSQTVPVESIRDTANEALVQHRLVTVAKAYVLHRFS